MKYDPKPVEKVLAKSDNAGYDMLRYVQPKLESTAEKSAESLEELIHTLCREKECKMSQVAQPIRVVVSGSTISPSIGVTLTVIDKHRTIARIRRCSE